MIISMPFYCPFFVSLFLFEKTPVGWHKVSWGHLLAGTSEIDLEMFDFMEQYLHK